MCVCVFQNMCVYNCVKSSGSDGAATCATRNSTSARRPMQNTRAGNLSLSLRSRGRREEGRREYEDKRREGRPGGGVLMGHMYVEFEFRDGNAPGWTVWISAAGQAGTRLARIRRRRRRLLLQPRATPSTPPLPPSRLRPAPSLELCSPAVRRQCGDEPHRTRRKACRLGGARTSSRPRRMTRVASLLRPSLRPTADCIERALGLRTREPFPH